MVSIKATFRPFTIDDERGKIFYQVSKDGEARLCDTDFLVFRHEWNESTDTLILAGDRFRVALLMSYHRQMDTELERLRRICAWWQLRNMPFTADDVLREYRRQAEQRSFFNFMSNIISELCQAGQERTTETYTAALNSFMTYREGEDISLDAFDARIVRDYDDYLRSRGNTRNTVSFYMRILRAVYNRAAGQNLIEQQNPFTHVFTGVEKTVKRAIPLDAVRRMKRMDLASKPSLEFARDMFMFSLYTRGMSFVDMAYLEKQDMNGGYISYTRSKTGQCLRVKVEPELMSIIVRYSVYASRYLLPIICDKDRPPRPQYRVCQRRVNRSLERIGSMLGIGTRLTMYVARHTWSSLAHNNNVPLRIISEALGHESEATTGIYLAHLDVSVLDNVNRKITALV